MRALIGITTLSKDNSSIEVYGEWLRSMWSTVWETISALGVLFILAAYRPVLVNIISLSNVSGYQAIPRALTVPEASHSQVTLQQRESSMPLLQGVQLYPAPQLVEIPPPSQ